MKSGPDALRTVENVSASAKNENGTRRPQYRKNYSRRAKRENGTRRPRDRRK
jgi:hypothetical protein